MKRISKFVFILVLIIAAVKGSAQTKVTGHVFAEVVESVSANSSSQSSVTIQRNQTDIIDFGQIEIKSEASATTIITSPWKLQHIVQLVFKETHPTVTYLLTCSANPIKTFLIRVQHSTRAKSTLYWHTIK
jgi:hypothetical protein